MNSPQTDDALDRLNAVERDLLGLLGRGHTAKSIATLRSMSEAAVNERFRSARRKTGIGSSREIARLIVARENRHDFMDLTRPATPTPELPHPDALRRTSRQRWRLPMAAAVLLAAAFLAQQTATFPKVPQTYAETSTEAGRATRRPAADVASLHAQVLADRADPAWSPATEAALTSVYQRIPTFEISTESHTVTCSASLCEVLAVGRTAQSTDQINAFIRSVQVPDLNAAESTLGMDLEMQHLTSTPTQTLVMAAYWRRRAD